jgi:hypothetical protein
VVDNRRPMLLVMRAMLAAIGAGRIHTYESPTGAIGTMATATPDLVIAADVMPQSERSGAGQDHEAPKLRSTRSRPGHYHNRARETRT